jgi:hypothetical protein
MKNLQSTTENNWVEIKQVTLTQEEKELQNTVLVGQQPSLQELLLSIPSTKQRLRLVLERFLQWQYQHWGDFQ